MDDQEDKSCLDEVDRKKRKELLAEPYKTRFNQQARKLGLNRYNRETT